MLPESAITLKGLLPLALGGEITFIVVVLVAPGAIDRLGKSNEHPQASDGHSGVRVNICLVQSVPLSSLITVIVYVSLEPAEPD
jgi:hypothetical protein